MKKYTEEFLEQIIFDELDGDYDGWGQKYGYSDVVKAMKIAYLKALIDYNIWSDYVPNGDDEYNKVVEEFNFWVGDKHKNEI